MNDAESPQLPASRDVEQLYREATAHHRAGRLRESEQLYRVILQVEPMHAGANHSLGQMLLQLGRAGEALPYLKNALKARPKQGHYWLSYIEGLVQIGQTDTARHMLAQGRQFGVKGPAVDALVTRLDSSTDGSALGPTTAELERIRLLHNDGRFSELESAARNLVERFPAVGSGWKLLGLAQHGQGLLEQARLSMQQAVNLSPGDWQIHYLLGNLHLLEGQLTEAEDCLRRCLSINADHADAFCKLGIVCKHQSNDTEAERCYRRALELNPQHADAFFNLGNLLGGQGRPDDAEACYRSAVALNPHFAQAQNNLGNLLMARGRHAEAETCFRAALALTPDFVEALGNLGVVLTKQDKLPEAETAFRQALTLNPDGGSAFSGLGNVLTLLGRVPEAERCYRQMLEIIRARAMAPLAENRAHSGLGRKDEVTALCCLAYTLMIQGQVREASDHYQQAQRMGAIPIEHRIHAALLLPPIYTSRDDIVYWRSRFKQGLYHLRVAADALDPSYLHMASFYLAYQNQNDCDLMTELNVVLREKVKPAGNVSDWVKSWSAPDLKKRRIRIGFLSEFFNSGHTIGKLYEGLIAGLDRHRFDVLVIQPGGQPQNTRPPGLDVVAENFIGLPEELASQRELIANLRLDVLFYPDVGMSAYSYFLASSRLAPVQAVGWGHPDTTGMRTIDYFVSAESIEPDDAQQHYTERLIRLSRLPCHYRTPRMATTAASREAFGLPATGTLYGCPQSLFKFHPDFDAVLADIADGDAEGRIVVLMGPQTAWTEQLRTRWAQSFPILLEKVLFLPRQPLDKFMALISHMDILLDPVHFGSGNTLYEAMIHGTPVVTWPGRFMRGRIVSGAYRQMAVPDPPVVQDIEDYAAMALALGRDPARRRAIRELSIDAARRDLYEDMGAVREFENFLAAAVAAAGRGEKLPPGWTSATIDGVA